MRPVQFGAQPPMPQFRGVSTYDPDTGKWTDETTPDSGDRWTPGDSELGEKPRERPMDGDGFYRQPELQIVPVTPDTAEIERKRREEIAIINSILDNFPKLPGIGPQKDDKTPTVH